MPGRLGSGFARRLPAVSQLPDDSPLDQSQSLPRHTLAIEGRAGLRGMIDVVRDADVFSEQLFVRAAGEEAASILDGGGAEVRHHFPYQLEAGAGLNNPGL